jgi:hypothetical protein
LLLFFKKEVLPSALGRLRHYTAKLRNFTEPALPPPSLPDRPLTPIERNAIDYSDLEHWMAHADQVIRDTRRRLSALAGEGDLDSQHTGAIAAPMFQAQNLLRHPRNLRPPMPRRVGSAHHLPSSIAKDWDQNENLIAAT